MNMRILMERPSQPKGESAGDSAKARESAAKVGGNYETGETGVLPAQ